MSFPAPTREWFRDWFGEEYLALYPHRDEAEAEQAVALFREVAGGARSGLVLDLACGAGRHLRALRRAGFGAVGLDLSMPLLRAAHSAAPADPLVRGDMRELPFASGSFGGLSSFFTSFGYFSDPTDDRRVLREMRRVMAADGYFMLDFLNSERVRGELVPRDVNHIEGGRVVQERTIEGGVVVKRILLERTDGSVRRFEERVRLYACDDLVDLLDREGLATEYRFGTYAGHAYSPASPRLILAGRASPGRKDER